MDMRGKREGVEELNQPKDERRTKMKGICPPPPPPAAPPPPPPPPPPPSCDFNSYALDSSEWGSPILDNVMEALADPNTHLVGVYGPDDNVKDTLLEIVKRRIQRGDLFDLVLTATVTRKPDRKKIQEEIAHQLGLTFNHKSKDNRAQELIERIKTEQRILIVLCDLHKRLDLGRVGIPYGSDHTGCKILLTSTTVDVLSNQMQTQQNFMV